MSNYYRVLCVSRFASRSEIRQAYRSLTRQIRQDCENGPHTARLARVEHAFQVLGDAERRRTYDSREGVARRTGTRQSGEVPDANEVARGFPSMLPIVPRIIGAFFGAPGRIRDTHSRWVELSPREALEGARIPVELPVRPTCPVCGGRGETWAEPCGICVGTGSGHLSHQLELPVPPGVRHGTRLKFSVTPPYAPETHVELRIAVR